MFLFLLVCRCDMCSHTHTHRHNLKQLICHWNYITYLTVRFLQVFFFLFIHSIQMNLLTNLKLIFVENFFLLLFNGKFPVRLCLTSCVDDFWFKSLENLFRLRSGEKLQKVMRWIWHLKNVFVLKLIFYWDLFCFVYFCINWNAVQLVFRLPLVSYRLLFF